MQQIHVPSSRDKAETFRLRGRVFRIRRRSRTQRGRPVQLSMALLCVLAFAQSLPHPVQSCIRRLLRMMKSSTVWAGLILAAQLVSAYRGEHSAAWPRRGGRCAQLMGSSYCRHGCAEGSVFGYVGRIKGLHRMYVPIFARCPFLLHLRDRKVDSRLELTRSIVQPHFSGTSRIGYL